MYGRVQVFLPTNKGYVISPDNETLITPCGARYDIVELDDDEGTEWMEDTLTGCLMLTICADAECFGFTYKVNASVDKYGNIEKEIEDLELTNVELKGFTEREVDADTDNDDLVAYFYKALKGQ